MPSIYESVNLSFCKEFEIVLSGRQLIRILTDRRICLTYLCINYILSITNQQIFGLD